jgi:hypothetical protein
MARTGSDAHRATRLEARRREDRGIVASYVHQLSERHVTTDDGAHGAEGALAAEEDTRERQGDP